MADTSIFPVTPTKRVKATGARQEIINMIKEANPGTVWGTVNWDDFRIEPVAKIDSDSEYTTRTTYGETLTYPCVYVSIKPLSVNKYTSTSAKNRFRFNVNNALNLDDVYKDVFNNKIEFTGVTVDELQIEIRKYIPRVKLVQVRTENNGKTVVYNLDILSLGLSDNSSTEIPFTALIDCSEKFDPQDNSERYTRERLEIKLHAAEDLIDFNPDNTNSDVTYTDDNGIYEEVPAA